MKCPLCRSQRFYVKDPQDAYETYPFNCAEGSICFDPDVDPSAIPSIDAETETFCNQCAWHGKMQELKQG
jgi:hypothetical protein